MRNLLIVLFALFLNTAFAKTFKIGVLAPEGTNWAKHMKKLAKEVKSQTGGKVKFKIYFGGAQGDEHDVLRKIRVGQLHGGIFTGKTLGDISGDVRVVEVPFTFHGDSDKAWKTVEKLTPYFNQRIAANEFMNLGFFELGMVYFVSQQETPSIDSLKGLKIWAWEGDKIVSTMIESLKLISVPLPLPDVLSSLSTGVIQAAYAPPMGMIALQWNTKIKYLVDFPLAYSMGAFLLDQKSWKKIKPDHQKIVLDLSKKYLAKVNESNRKDNVDALTTMKAMGVKFLKFPESDQAKGAELRKGIIKKLKGDLFTAESLKKLDEVL